MRQGRAGVKLSLGVALAGLLLISASTGIAASAGTCVEHLDASRPAVGLAKAGDLPVTSLGLSLIPI